MSNQSIDVKAINPSQLKVIIQDLKKSTNVDQMITNFQTLGKFCTSSEAATGQILEDVELSKFVSESIENHEDKAVRIHASAFLLTLSFSVGKFKKGFVADTALSMFINLFQEIECPQNLELVEAIEHQLKHAPFSPRTLDGSISIIQKLTHALNSDKISENTKKMIVDTLTDILDGDFFTPMLHSKGSSSSLPLTSFFSPSTPSSPSSSSSSSSSSPDYPPSFLHALFDLYTVLAALGEKTRGRLSTYSLGLSVKIKKSFGEKVGDKARMEEPSPKLPNDYLNPVDKWLGGSKRYILLFKASSDGYSTATFHAKCDNKGPTVTIITSTEGYVFGGYAAVSWSCSGNTYIPDNSGQSFLFSLKNPRKEQPAKFRLKDNQYALRCHPSFNVMFGNGGDIYCYSSNVGNYSNLSAYDNQTGLSGNVVFTGKQDFVAQEIEVYQVV